VLLRALQQIRADWQLEVVGDGHARASLEALACELGISDRVRFAGWVDDVNPCYERARCVVVPSVWPEPFGIVGIEALSHGRPVVGSDVGGIPDWCRHAETGLLAPPGDVAGLASRIESVLRDDRLASDLGARGREVACQEYGPEVHVDQLLQAYHASLNGGKG
jgi:glycosyltransferase involved in cell wall biosynthesis